ncbi:MAG: right-handed parallel beta-helix repeat-containing protein, partial [Actinobacteria bacterium]|nr:right-handed parallel beta-helix repeat-containing protein [Actinomycetota bacterium]
MTRAPGSVITAIAVSALVALCFLVGCGTGIEHLKTAKVASGNTYYVSPSGSNSNPGTREAPWATPGYGSKELHAGDTMVILGGRYSLSTYGDDMITPTTGASGAWITIKGEVGNRPVLAGKDDLFSAVDISNTSYIRIENLEITSDNGAKFRGGVEASGGPANHVVLEDLYIHHIDDFGVNIGDVSDFKIIDCEMLYCGFGGIGGPAGSHGGIRDLLVSGCSLSYSGHYYQGGPGPGPYDRPDGFGIEPSEGPIEIRDTVAEHNLGDGLDSKAANTYIHECVVANNTCDGVKLWAHDSKIENTLIYGTGDGADSQWVGIVVEDSQTPNARFEIINVTLDDNPSRQAYPMTVQYDISNPITLTMKNTIVSNGHGEAYFGDSVGLTADHNIFYRPSEEVQVHANGRDYTAAQIEAGELGAENLCSDPMFVSPAWGKTGDYHLRSGSPAIDAGTSDGAPSIDLDGNARPHGKGYDIGAYEFGAGKPNATTWYMPEGCTAGGFETWVLLQNPGGDRSAVELTYMTPSGEIDGPTVILEPESRQTVNVSDTLPDTWSVSTMASSDRPVVAERATYWGNRTGGHSSI